MSPDAGSHPGVLGAVTPLGLTGSFRLATWGKRVGPDLTEGLATNDGWPEITVFPPPDAPAAASAWFAALTGRERDWLISQRPDWVGPADGLPAWARDRANWIRLDQLTQQGAAELTALQEAELDSGERARRLGEVRAIVDGLAAVRALLATDDGRTRQLLSLDLQGQVLTAAVTTGDLDGAGHIPIFVPGFQADVAGDLARYSALVESAADRADRLSRTDGDGRPVVGITWLGYAAPQVGQVLVPGRSVAGWGPANAGAPRLVQLLTGLDAAGRHGIPGGRAGQAGPQRQQRGRIVSPRALRDPAHLVDRPGVGPGGDGRHADDDPVVPQPGPNRGREPVRVPDRAGCVGRLVGRRMDRLRAPLQPLTEGACRDRDLGMPPSRTPASWPTPVVGGRGESGCGRGDVAEDRGVGRQP